jgi:hypothetical protein
MRPTLIDRAFIADKKHAARLILLQDTPLFVIRIGVIPNKLCRLHPYEFCQPLNIPLGHNSRSLTAAFTALPAIDLLLNFFRNHPQPPVAMIPRLQERTKLVILLKFLLAQPPYLYKINNHEKGRQLHYPALSRCCGVTHETFTGLVGPDSAHLTLLLNLLRALGATYGAETESSRIKTMELAEIQQAIEQLPKDQQAALAAWLAERDQAEWEAEIERDFAPGGAGMAFLEETKAETRLGKFRPFEQGRKQNP